MIHQSLYEYRTNAAQNIQTAEKILKAAQILSLVNMQKLLYPAYVTQTSVLASDYNTCPSVQLDYYVKKAIQFWFKMKILQLNHGIKNVAILSYNSSYFTKKDFELVIFSAT